MNDIFIRQNSPKQLHILRAVNAVYNRAKAFNAMRFIACVVAPTAVNFSFLLFENDIVKATLCFVVMVLMAISFALEEVVTHYSSSGALIQQHYDLELYRIGELSSSDMVKIEPYLTKYGDKSFKRECNWYNDYSSLDELIAILYCQKENVLWTKRLTFRYFLIVSLTALASFIPIILFFVLKRENVSSIILFLYNLIPVISFVCLSLYRTNRENSALKECDLYCTFLLGLHKDNKLEKRYLVEMQNLIFDYRKTKRIIPQWLYKLFYKKDSYIEDKNANQRGINK